MANVTIDQFISETTKAVGGAAKAIKLEVFAGVIDDTRVDTGRLKGNWQTSTGGPKTGVVESEDKSGVGVKAQAEETVTEIGVDYLSNNLDYAPLWEERDGMIARNLARVETIVRRTKK